MRVSTFFKDQEASLDALRLLGRLRDGGARIFYGHDGAFWETVPQARPLA